jgi:hypothetical protein
MLQDLGTTKEGDGKWRDRWGLLCVFLFLEKMFENFSVYRVKKKCQPIIVTFWDVGKKDGGISKVVFIL